MTATARQRELLTFIGERIGTNTEEYSSFSGLTGYASSTRRQALAREFDHWVDLMTQRGELERAEIWAIERGFPPESPVATFTLPTRRQDLLPGDIVRLVGGSWRGHPNEGTEQVVREVHGEYTYLENGNILNEAYPFVFVSRLGQETVTPEVTTPEVPEGLEFTEYHPALLPLFTKAAQAATEAGYCSEYDSIAAAVGAPNRDEIRRLSGKKYTVTVPLTVNVEIEATGYTESDAVSDVRRNGFSSFDGIRDLIAASIGVGRDGQTWGGPVANNVRGYQSQYQDTWTVTEAPTP